jgi:hypothetical protein
MLLSLVYFAVRRLLRLLTRGSEHGDVAREIEILVLRHQLRVLARGRRMPLRRRDRVLLAAAGSLLPRQRWRAFAVSPQTGLPEFVGILSLLHRRFACSERFDGLQNAVSCRHTIT